MWQSRGSAFGCGFLGQGTRLSWPQWRPCFLGSIPAQTRHGTGIFAYIFRGQCRHIFHTWSVWALAHFQPHVIKYAMPHYAAMPVNSVWSTQTWLQPVLIHFGYVLTPSLRCRFGIHSVHTLLRSNDIHPSGSQAKSRSKEPGARTGHRSNWRARRTGEPLRRSVERRQWQSPSSWDWDWDVPATSVGCRRGGTATASIRKEDAGSALGAGYPWFFR